MLIFIFGISTPALITIIITGVIIIMVLVLCFTAAIFKPFVVALLSCRC